MRTSIVLLLLLIGACQYLEPQPTLVYPEPPETVPDCEQIVTPSQLAKWLQVVSETEELSPEQALAEIAELDTHMSTRFQRFRYAVLNQRLHDRAGWIRARDTLRELTEAHSLEVDELRLATMLMQYNQEMINAEARQHQMAKELDATQLAQRQLEQKIQALTSLEQNISIRKEQAIEQQESTEPEATASPSADPGH